MHDHKIEILKNKGGFVSAIEGDFLPSFFFHEGQGKLWAVRYKGSIYAMNDIKNHGKPFLEAVEIWLGQGQITRKLEVPVPSEIQDLYNYENIWYLKAELKMEGQDPTIFVKPVTKKQSANYEYDLSGFISD